MTLARAQILREIAECLRIEYDVARDVCAWCDNTTTLGLIAQQVRACRVVLAGGRLQVAEWVKRDKLDADSLRGVLAVAREGLPLLGVSVAMVVGGD